MEGAFPERTAEDLIGHLKIVAPLFTGGENVVGWAFPTR
jgi:hypothetical protein